MLIRGVHSLVLFALLSHEVAGCPAHPSRKHRASSYSLDGNLNSGWSTPSATFSRALVVTSSSFSPSYTTSLPISKREPSFSKAAEAGSASHSASLLPLKSETASASKSLQTSSSITVGTSAQVSASAHASPIESAVSSSKLSAVSSAIPSASGRPLTPDNTCGGPNGYTCNPNDPLGGTCCSASGFCGTICSLVYPREEY